ncbi:class I SAM-dependent methyltransferase [Solihabitans fulvus]|uniref:class I SAM-dependent methyltransferase n=1 Tax=Solihabitans fulvus TaxID=1892852 RepID=UPI001661CC0C|nr:class I SAM-dependent methyltransferase [Solihabitans fulvus]
MSSIIASLEMVGLLDLLEADGIGEEVIVDRMPDAAALLRASLRFLAQRGVVEESAAGYALSDYGREVCRDKGYLVWLVGGYGEPLRRIESFLGGGKRYGEDYVRDGKWVAGGAALLGGRDVVPQAKDLLRQTSFNQVLDLGCGNARLLISLCQEFDANGVGIDISPEACADARAAVAAQHVTDRVVITQADAGALGEIDALANTDLVVTFFLLHEILALGKDVLIAYLTEMARILPGGAHLLIAEVEPPARESGLPERFTPEFTYVHALMRQVLIPADEWVAVLETSGFAVRTVQRNDMPGGILLLAQTSA